MKRLKKKGFVLQDIPQIALVLVVAALLISISAQILNTMKGTSGFAATTPTLTRTNDTFTALFGTNVTFQPTSLVSDSAGRQHSIACSVTSIYNYSAKVHTTNFTVSGCQAALLNETLNNTEIGVDYTYTHYSYGFAYNNTETGEEVQEDFSEWLPTFVVIMAAAVVLGLIGKYIMM